MKMSKVKCQRSNVPMAGFGLVEIIVAMGIFALVATTGVTTVLNSFIVNRLGEEETFANLYAQEGIEAARSIKNKDWADMAAGSHGVNNSGGSWVFSGTQDANGKYTRVVRLDEIQRIDTFCNLDIIPTGGTVDQDTYKATSTVTWDFSSGRSNTVEVFTYLANFKDSGQGGSSQIGSSNLPGNRGGKKIQIQGDYAYIIRDGGSPDFVIVDISDPCALVDVGSLNLGSTPENIAVSGNYAYIASTHNSQELQIIDVSDPANPFVVSGGTYNAPQKEDALGVYVVGTNVYLVRSTGTGHEFFIIDVTSPSSPSLIGSTELGDSANEVVVLGIYAYLASNSNSQELQVVNISNPSSPTLLTSLDLSGNSDATTISGFGSTVLLGRGQLGGGDEFVIIDVTTPSSPSVLDSYDAQSQVNDIATGNSNANAFLGTDEPSAEFQHYDITDPANIQQLRTLNVSGSINGVAYHQDQGLVYAVGDNNNEELIVIQP